MEKELEKLKTTYQGLHLYQAGIPGYPRNFTRDSIISAIISSDPKMLEGQLKFCAQRQGLKKNSTNGEEPGKIFHEYPPVEIDGLSTEFNACDTTALFLIGHEVYQKLTKNDNLFENQRENIQKAVDYILAHLKNNLFIESPEFAGANRFALKTTYWKDGGIIQRENGTPTYPIIYTLAHIQNARALKSAALLLKREDLSETASLMIRSLGNLYDNELNSFYIALDEEGPIKGISSDSLHALFYLSPDDLPIDIIKNIVKASAILETEIGYRTLDKNLSTEEDKVSQYYGNLVWPFEQAIINAAAKKFGLAEVEEITSRIKSLLDTAPEFFLIKNNNSIEKSGSDPQLWTAAAKKYFTLEAPVLL